MYMYFMNCFKTIRLLSFKTFIEVNYDKQSKRYSKKLCLL